jgi:hypothetical protein
MVSSDQLCMISLQMGSQPSQSIMFSFESLSMEQVLSVWEPGYVTMTGIK